MSQAPSFRGQLAKTFVFPLLSLFLLPLLAQLFVQHAVPQIDASILASIERNIDTGTSWPAADKQQAKLFYRSNPPSGVCHSRDEALADYREGVCERYSPLWQFSLVDRATWWMLVAGALVLLAVLALGAAAFASRQAQHRSFVTGWRLLVLASALEVIAQGALLVWLSYWVTVFFFELYYPKLILLLGVLVAVAVFSTVVGIFRRPPQQTAVEGELLAPADAPALWAHVKELAAKLNTRAPDQIVAGIDANFFVTEAPLTVAGQAVRGRTLFVSLPLLGILERPEADAVLAHELAHLRGGDTASSAALGPKLTQYDYYCQMMASAGATLPVFYLMQLYRVIFEFALKRESRAREFLADRTAAALVSARAMVQSLVKLAAYSNYRQRIESKLFEHDQRHQGVLGIAGVVAAGLAPYAGSREFLDEMKSANVPHPFDTHPLLSERMANVGLVVGEQDMADMAAKFPAQSWLGDILTARDIEQRLWASYEQRFADVHEENLAYRYEPANEAERAIVVKYFPPIVFPLKKDQRIEVNHVGLVLPGQTEALSWDSVHKLNYENGFGGDVLQIVHPEKSWLGAKSTKVKLPGIGKERERFKQTMGRYWQRHQYMRQQAVAHA